LDAFEPNGAIVFSFLLKVKLLGEPPSKLETPKGLKESY